jgi:uncharacterized SAM-binding protein YcdF (DUF218 family)
VTTTHLAPHDYHRLAQIMAGLHGQPVTTENPVDLLVVFACADPEVGRTAARLYADKLVRHVIFSGGVGKDSGGLSALGISEAVFLASIAIAEGLPSEAITLEEAARNGKENVSFLCIWQLRRDCCRQMLMSVASHPLHAAVACTKNCGTK